MSEAVSTPVLNDAVNAELEDWGPLEEATGHPMATHGVELWAQGTASRGGLVAGPARWLAGTGAQHVKGCVGRGATG